MMALWLTSLPGTIVTLLQIMGNSGSSLPPQSQPGSPLQVCLDGAFANNKGALSYPQHIGYAQAVKLYNTAVPVLPAAVVRPTTSEEVAAVVRCAVASALKVQGRGGGHSYANFALGDGDGAVVVDLVKFQKFEMNRETWRATVGAGTLLGDLTTKMHNAGGRAMAHGTCPQVGIGGHATIGGLGPTSRMWGSALDHVEEVEVVLANSTIIRASNAQNQDVFFAMKGAAAGFGIITEFVVRTQPEPAEVVQYSYNLALGSKAKMASTFATWQAIIADPNLTRKLASQVIVFELGMLITGTYFGSKAEFQALEFEKRIGQGAQSEIKVFNNWLGTVSNWAENEALKLVGGISGSFYSKSLAFTKNDLIPQSGIDNLFKFFDTDKGTLIWFAIFDLEAGAINDVPQDATAYAHRDALFYVQTYAVGITGITPKIRGFIEGINKIIQDSLPNSKLGAYAGYVDPALPNAQQAYWGSNLPRLQAIKKAIDPQDVFHNPQSVRPAA